MKTAANLPNDNLSIQQNERIMNHKKKDSNSHLNKQTNNTDNFPEKNTTSKKENPNYNSAKKYGNSPRDQYENNKNQTNINANCTGNNFNNNYDFSIKGKRPYENIVQTQATPYSGVNTDNSDNLIKSNANKNSAGNYNSHKIESSSGNSNNNMELFSSAARFYESKSIHTFFIYYFLKTSIFLLIFVKMFFPK